MEDAGPSKPPTSLKLKIRIPLKKPEQPVPKASPSPPSLQKLHVYTPEQSHGLDSDEQAGSFQDDRSMEDDSESGEDDMRLGSGTPEGSDVQGAYPNYMGNYSGGFENMDGSEDDQDEDEAIGQSFGTYQHDANVYPTAPQFTQTKFDPFSNKKNKSKHKHGKTKGRISLESGGEGKSKIKLRLVGIGSSTKGPRSPLAKVGSSFLSLPPVQNYTPLQRKQPRLKTLAETLPKLTAKIKKKDAYGIFLQPVDVKALPQYLTIIEHPMDLGTMTTKVDKGQYNSLDQFTADFRLMINNCKTFNPPPSLYWTEAEKLETSGLEAIAQAAATLVDPADEPTPPPMKIESRNDTPAMGADIEYYKEELDTVDYTPRSYRPVHSKHSSMSTSMKQELPLPATYVQSTISGSGVVLNNPKLRGPYRKTIMREQPMVGPDGELPGTSAGVGVFPVGSELGNIALALEVRGRRYRTKRERQKIEKEGQPRLDDGSIDYAQLEDPFSVLSHLLPRALETPGLYALSQASADKDPEGFQTSVNPADFERRVSNVAQSMLGQARPVTVQRGMGQVRSTRMVPEGVDGGEEPQYQLPTRFMSHWDMGLFQSILKNGDGNDLRKAVTQLEQSHFPSSENHKQALSGDSGTVWSVAGAQDGFQHIRDVVYGGVDGLAYSRSILDFTRKAPTSSNFEESPAGTINSEAMEVDDSPSESEWEEPPGGLGMSLRDYVEKHVLSSITGDLHGVVDQVGEILCRESGAPSGPDTGKAENQDVRSLTALSLGTYPTLRRIIDESALSRRNKLALTSLVKAQSDLYSADTAWLSDTALPQGHVASGFTQQWAADALQITADRILSKDKDITETQVNNTVNGIDTESQQHPLNAEESAELQNLRYSLITLAKFAPLSEIS